MVTEKSNKIETSIRVDEELWMDFRIKAIRERKSISGMLEEALKAYFLEFDAECDS